MDSLDKKRLVDEDLADLGFENVRFKGARLLWNENIQGTTTHPIYFLNSDYLSFVIHSQRNFKTTSFVSPWDQDARVSQIYLAGQLTCSNRRRLGVCWVSLA